MSDIKVGSLPEAIAVAEELKAAGRYDWFRGQARDWRPLRTSLGRLDETGRKHARERVTNLWKWMNDVAELAPIVADRDAFFAVAQHYRIPTNYMDFTTEPRVAGFFAAHMPPPDVTPDESSCILCLNTADLAHFWRGIATAKPDWPEPRRVSVDVPELWRLHAQAGVFLFLPYDRFDDRIYNFDRLCFPPGTDPTILVPVEDVYPEQKSDLEILLDQYFMLEMMEAGDAAVDRDNFFVVNIRGLAGGIEAECFGERGLPEHGSWSASAVAAWKHPTPEAWTELSRAPRITLQPSSAQDARAVVDVIAAKVLDLLRAQPELRSGPVLWTSGDEATSSAMRLYWDGVRRWPYRDQTLARGIGVIAALGPLVAAESPGARNEPAVYEPLIEACIGPAIEVELGMSDSSYTRGYCARESLRAAVPPDFWDYLNDTWRPQITEIEHVLQVVVDPRRAFVFEHLTNVFIEEIVSTQVVLRGEKTGKARLYNLARAVSLGLP